MINKRLLIKNLLAHNDENSFYDKKLQLSFGSREGKAKFLKHICGLSNSNPKNNSYLVIGVRDTTNEILGVDFFDDSKIQNLVNAYLENAPVITYENIPFPSLPNHKVVGLVSIRPRNDLKICALRKNIWKYYGGMVFFREGSISKPKAFDIEVKDINSDIVKSIEDHSQNNIKLTLDGTFDFFESNKDFDPHYRVFKEYFVLCWAGKAAELNGEHFYSRVNIQLVNEQVKLFYSDQDQIQMEIDDDEFRILEYVRLFTGNDYKNFPLEKVYISFNDNMMYDIKSKLIFEPPRFEKKSLYHIYNSGKQLLKKIINNIKLDKSEVDELRNLPSIYLICYLNGFDTALDELSMLKNELKLTDTRAYQNYKDSMRILRKIKYN